MPPSIFKPGGTPGDSENATKQASIFKPGGTPGDSENATQKPEHFQAGWHTRRLGKCDQTKHFQAGWHTRASENATKQGVATPDAQW
jgi:hypothetical protein